MSKTKETWRKGKASVLLDPSCPEYAEQSKIFAGQGYKKDGAGPAQKTADEGGDPAGTEGGGNTEGGGDDNENGEGDEPTRGRGRGR